ncbi:myogenesis-regulating glycosidase-like isoform X2 [Nilaparvata lugens]|nr:myogenesis-regulating glycosidase-like isoform X2 [Nilaparvata lugens]
MDKVPQLALSRRNSISLPNVMMEPPEYEPQLTPERQRSDVGGGGGYDTSDTFSDCVVSTTTDDEEDDDEEERGRRGRGGGGGGLAEEGQRRSSAAKVPVRNARKKSVMPMVHRGAQGDSQETIEIPDHSPGNSITSINSISSLLKEKLVMSFPRVLKKRRKPKEYKLQSFVAMLFLSISFLVGFAHVFYHQQVLQRAYFDRIRFNKEERLVRVFDSESGQIALGYLGVQLPDTDRVFHCLPNQQKSDGSVCMEWLNHARLYLNYRESAGLRCYHITWTSLQPAEFPTDCYEDGGDYGHWYGGGRTLGMAWPVELGRVEMSAFVTGHVGRHRWGSVLKRYFINSRGVAIAVDANTPLYVSINDDEKTRLCLQARYDDFAYIRPSADSLAVLNYSVCTSSNMKQLHSSLSEKSLWDGLKRSDVEVVHSLLTEPVWQIAPLSPSLLTEQAVINYTEAVIGLGFLRQGHVLLNEFWQTEVGDFTVDEERFPTMEKTIDIFHRRGFRIALSIQPYISTESINFAPAVRQGLLVTERGRKHRRVPALTSYKSVASAGMLDITNNQSTPWLLDKLNQLRQNYHIDSFYLDLGTAHDMPQYYRMERNLTNPDHYKQLLTAAILSGQLSVLGVSGAVARPPAPVFVSLPSLPSTWESLQVIIPTVLTYGIIGYPFLLPGPVGGDYLIESPFRDSLIKGNLTAEFSQPDTSRPEQSSFLPVKELYIRWLQLATFLPVIRYSHLPSDYVDSPDVLAQAKQLTALRQKIINPLLKKYAEEALDWGAPLIRPLWMLDPSDSACHLVVDEFSLGDELLVAPILSPQQHEREVYLPAGVWKDGIDGSLRKGSRWIHNYKVPLEKIAHFLKMPDNTRF